MTKSEEIWVLKNINLVLGQETSNLAYVHITIYGIITHAMVRDKDNAHSQIKAYTSKEKNQGPRVCFLAYESMIYLGISLH